MILNSTLIGSIKEDTQPEDGDSIVKVPPILLPVIELGLPFQSIFSSTVAGPYSAAQIMRVTSLFGFACFQVNVAASATLIGAIGPGVWEIDAAQTVMLTAAAAGVAFPTGIAIGFDPLGLTETGNFTVNSPTSNNLNASMVRKITLCTQRNIFLTCQLPAVGAGVTIFAFGSVSAKRLA